MGTWGVQFDENDGAQNFLGDVEEARDWSEVDERIRDYVDDGGYDDADQVVAALELVAAALGRASPRLKPELAEWAVAHKAEAERVRAQAVEAAGLVSDASELSELWDEGGESNNWRATISDLRARVQA